MNGSAIDYEEKITELGNRLRTAEEKIKTLEGLLDGGTTGDVYAAATSGGAVTTKVTFVKGIKK